MKIFYKITPRHIFPSREIGLLKESYEASFLVLEQNPLVDIKAINKIGLKLKQGTIIK